MGSVLQEWLLNLPVIQAFLELFKKHKECLLYVKQFKIIQPY